MLGLSDALADWFESNIHPSSPAKCSRQNPRGVPAYVTSLHLIGRGSFRRGEDGKEIRTTFRNS